MLCKTFLGILIDNKLNWIVHKALITTKLSKKVLVLCTSQDNCYIEILHDIVLFIISS